MDTIADLIKKSKLLSNLRPDVLKKISGQLLPEQESQHQRRLRVIENVKRNQRLRGWVMSMRTAGEVGIGDTLARLIKLAGRRAILCELKAMHRACSCNKIEATEKLNRDYPY